MVSYGAASADTLFARDSTGVKTQNGKTYITHKVTPGETFYALSRKYGVAVNKIIEANKAGNKALVVGQTVLIPINTPAGSTRTATAKATPAAPAETPASTSTATTASLPTEGSAKGNKVHKVQPGQTLFSIARQNKVSVDDLKKWNKLSTNTVVVGQNLVLGPVAKTPTQATASTKAPASSEPEEVVSAPKQSSAPATAATPASTTETPAKESSTKKSTAVAAKTETPVKAEATTKAADAEDEKETGKTTEYVSRVNESGMAEQIDTRTDANKFLALHKSAPVGTIMAVKNPMNDQIVYVRVIGKLPSTGDNDKLVVKLSKKACQQIGASDKRFRVEVSYMP